MLNLWYHNIKIKLAALLIVNINALTYHKIKLTQMIISGYEV